MKKYLQILLALTLIYTSCTDRKRTHIEQTVKNWQERKIHLPENATFVRYGTDTINYDFSEAEYKILVYMDSAGCSGCQLKPDKWKAFMNKVDSVATVPVAYLFYISRKNIEDLTFLLRNNHCGFPICFNREKQLDSLNHFPPELMFRTFLLDRNNQVKIIGNPIHNVKIQELYLKELAQQPRPEGNITELHFTTKTINAGILPQGKQTTITFEGVNIGQVPLLIRDIIPDNPNTEITCTRKAVNPGTPIQITATITIKKQGTFTENLLLYGNIGEPIKLTITGDAQ